MKKVELLLIEEFLLSYAHARYHAIGFPSPTEFTVVERVFSGAGSWTYLSHQEEINVIDGSLILTQVEFGDPSHLLLAELDFENKHCKCLELIAGGDAWNGIAMPPFTLYPD
jgi:hypothetical protein